MRFMIEWIIEFQAKTFMTTSTRFPLIQCAREKESGRRNDICLTFLFEEKGFFFVLLNFHIQSSDKDVRKGLLFIRPCKHRM